MLHFRILLVPILICYATTRYGRQDLDPRQVAALPHL